MISIPNILHNYTSKEWPTLEVNNFSRSEVVFFIVFYLLDLAYSLNLFINGPTAEQFAIPMMVPLALLLLKSRLFFVAFLIAGQFLTAFLTIGAPENLLKYTLTLLMILVTVANAERGYYLAIISLFFFFITSVQGYHFIHVISLFLVFSLIANRDKLSLSKFSRQHKFNIMLFCFFIWVNLAALWGANFSDVFYCYFDILCLFIIYALTLIIVNDESRVIKVLLIWSIAGVIYGLARFVIQPSEKELIGLFAAKNTVSSLLNYSIFCTLVLVSMRRYSHLMLTTMAAIMIVINYVVGSKAGFLSMIIGLLIYFILIDNNYKKRKKVLLTITTVGIMIFLLLQIPLVPLVYMKLKNVPLPMEVPPELQTILFRFEQWELGEQMVYEDGNPYLGTGMGGYSILYKDYYPSEEKPEPWQNHPHSIYVFTYVDYGLIGLIIFMGILTAFFWTLRNFINRSRNGPLRLVALAVYAMTFSFLIHALVDWALVDKRFWFFLGLGIAIILVDRNKGYPEVAIAKPDGNGTEY